ncbi:MAG: hypothetical protein Unbinned8261contig1001_49 [Prokaryotic dsDNA virus sp.]|nr:MAG: hypothetical protein Unbinned8261contig1001_49 [Prokaryotic dsDNA virus sp.]|tara:strand:+ start:220 stop:1413 length:1194 start_codon:yes stop_codon:yes gene_type:complete
MSSERLFSLTEASALFKIKYEKLSENVYNSANVLLGRCKKSYNFTGKQLNIAIPQSFSGGVGSGSLPKANTAIYGDAQITSKKMYAVVELDRESIKAALSDEGAFVRATKEVVQKGVESFMRNLSRALFSDSTGALGTCAGTPSVADGNTTVTISNFKEANFEERDLVNVDSGSTAIEIVSVDPANSQVTLKGDVSATAVDTAILYMQGSKDNDPDGLKGVCDATTGSNYNISVSRRWQSHQKAAASAAISTDLLNEMMLAVKKKAGKSPNLIVCSYTQYEKILNLLEDQKRYQVPTRAGLKSKSGADISFSGVEFMSVDGPVGIFPERFVEDDRIYFLNDNHIQIHHRPDFGWFDDDGTVFLRKADSDAYEARYGGYLNIYINPCFHGVLTGLSTS